MDADERLAEQVREQGVTLRWLVGVVGPLLEGRSVRVKRLPAQRPREGVVESCENFSFRLRMADGSTCRCSVYDIEEVYR